jgi:hypothetical protein
MRLGIQNPLIQAHNILRLKQQVKILQRLREPEALHLVVECRRQLCDVVNRRVAVLRRRVPVNGKEHVPADFAPVHVAGNAVHVPYGFDCFGAKRKGG